MPNRVTLQKKRSPQLRTKQPPIQRPIPRERSFSPTLLRPFRTRPFRTPKEMLSRGVQALSEFLSSLSSTLYLDIEGKLNRSLLVSTLTDFLMYQQKALSFYDRVSDHFINSEIKKNIQHFVDLTNHHVHLYENAVRDLNGDPNQISVRGKYIEEWLNAHFKPQVSSEFQEWADFENIFMLESLHLHCFEIIREMIPFCEDTKTQNILQKLSDELEDGEKEQNQWIRRTLTHWIIQNLVLPVEERQAA